MESAARGRTSSVNEWREVAGPVDRSAWRIAVKGDAHALVYHNPEWVDCLCATGGYVDATRMFESRDGRRMVIPMVSRRLPGTPWSVQWSMAPGWGTGGFVSADPLEPEDLTAVVAHLRGQRGVLRTFIQPSPRRASLWDRAVLPGVKVIPRLAHVLDLTGGYETVWSKRFTGSARTAVRKSEKLGVIVERDTTGRLLPEFYDLVQASVARWAEQQHEPLPLARWRARRRDPLSKFQAIATAVPSAFNLYLARHEGRAVAGVLVYHGAGAMYSRGAMSKDDAGPLRANYALHRAAIEDACLAGCSFYDFGESGESVPLAQFKTRFGATPAPYRELVLEDLPITELDRALRGAVKRAIGFRETAAPASTGGRGPAGARG